MARRVNRPELFARAAVTAPGAASAIPARPITSLVRLLNEALERLGDKDSPLRAQALARLGIELYWSDRERSVALCQQAVEMARRLDDPHTLIVALWGRRLSLRNPDSLEQRLADGREVIAVAERARRARFRARSALLSGRRSCRSGRHSRRRPGLARISGRRGGAQGPLQARAPAAGHARAHGRTARGGGVAGAAGLHRRPAERAAAHPQRVSGPARRWRMWELGRLGELEPQLRAYMAQNPLIVFARCGLQLTLRPARTSRRGANGVRKPGRGRVRPRAARLELARVHVRAGRDLRRSRRSQTRGGPLSAARALFGAQRHARVVSHLRLGRLRARQARRAARALRRAEAHFETALAANRANSRGDVALAHTQCELAKLLLARARRRRRASGRMRSSRSARRTAEALNLVRVRQKLERLGADRPAPAEREPVAAIAGGLAESGATVEAPSLGGARIEPEGAALDTVAASAMSQAAKSAPSPRSTARSRSCSPTS